MDAATLRATGAECTAFLLAHTEGDWSAPVPELKWSVREVAAHIGDTLSWYANDLAAGATELSTKDIRVRPDSSPVDLARTVSASVTVLAAVVDAGGPDARGWHPWGIADASGFAAMGCDELLVHTGDAARGLGVAFTPSPEPASATLRRLFPWAPAEAEPWRTLLWANGRTALPGRPRLTGWRWHCAPLSEWDGSAPDGAR
ncbi:maleylpyruvate isomerase family mycothiol-dependent enzyme [Qaidamihabitans albus]|uniref:maleylpyruvate isomerase family mycothiol-dependent enzyme n=1 Tax=Qaidamihabitans albus TaxID=2795733 RepID=UPI0018F161B8|nr:maleylpyruvate isomerase family mycothiol-dependent enzyme [Qaidamihabitans albus]